MLEEELAATMQLIEKLKECEAIAGTLNSAATLQAVRDAWWEASTHRYDILSSMGKSAIAAHGAHALYR
jgi:hypothetical protein